MTLIRPRRTAGRILPLLRPAGWWLLILMVLTLALPTAWCFTPSPQGREILLEPSTTGFGAELPDILVETTAQPKQASPQFPPPAFITDHGSAPPPSGTVLPGSTATPTLLPTTGYPLPFAARPPPHA